MQDKSTKKTKRKDVKEVVMVLSIVYLSYYSSVTYIQLKLSLNILIAQIVIKRFDCANGIIYFA